MKYTFTLVEPANESGNDKPAREKLVLESRAGESDRHIALKILAYVLFKGESAPRPLRIEQGVGQRHKPDLVATDGETGGVLLWIDCGQIETKRLGRIAAQNPRAQIIVVKPTANEARLYAQAALRFLPTSPERRAQIHFVGFGEEFLAEFLQLMRGNNDVQVQRGTDRLTVSLNSVLLTTPLINFIADEKAS